MHMHLFQIEWILKPGGQPASGSHSISELLANNNIWIFTTIDYYNDYGAIACMQKCTIYEIAI